MSAGLESAPEAAGHARGFQHVSGRTTLRSGLEHDVFKLLAAREAVEIGGHHAPAPVGGRLGAARTVRRDQHVGQFVERTPRWLPLRFGLGRVLPPYIERGAAEAPLFQRRIKRVLVDNRRPRDIDQQRAWLQVTTLCRRGCRGVARFSARDR